MTKEKQMAEITTMEVVRHFLRVEATRPKFAAQREELLACCELPDSEILAVAKRFSEERDDLNPVFAYAVGRADDGRHKNVTGWTRQRVRCRDIYTCGISPEMLPDIHAVRGNIPEFALKFAGKYPEFQPLSELDELLTVVILVHHRQGGWSGDYEVLDGAHRLVALCRAGIEEVEAYVAQLPWVDEVESDGNGEGIL